MVEIDKGGFFFFFLEITQRWYFTRISCDGLKFVQHTEERLTCFCFCSKENFWVLLDLWVGEEHRGSETIVPSSALFTLILHFFFNPDSFTIIWHIHEICLLLIKVIGQWGSALKYIICIQVIYRLNRLYLCVLRTYIQVYMTQMHTHNENDQR